MTLKEVTYYQMDYGEFEELVKEVYGVSDYELPCSEECSNGSHLTFLTLEEEELDEWEKTKLKEFISKNGNTSFVAHILIKDLVYKQKLPKGRFLIRVSW